VPYKQSCECENPCFFCRIKKISRIIGSKPFLTGSEVQVPVHTPDATITGYW
jgi:hypothetical protein